MIIDPICPCRPAYRTSVASLCPDAAVRAAGLAAVEAEAEQPAPEVAERLALEVVAEAGPVAVLAAVRQQEAEVVLAAPVRPVEEPVAEAAVFPARARRRAAEVAVAEVAAEPGPPVAEVEAEAGLVAVLSVVR